MRKTDLLIIGGGPAGLLLSNLYKNSILLEKENSCGKKLLLTGGGMCNFTHQESPREIINHYYEKKSFVSSSLGSFPPDKIISYFASIGVESFTRDDGCVFPKEKKAEAVLNALLKNSGEIITSVKIEAISKEEDTFLVSTNIGVFSSPHLVIATGGQSYPGTGSTGDGYKIAKQFGHSITPIKAGLSEIKIKDSFPHLEGLSIENVKLKVGKAETEGDLLFTRRGISGPGPMRLSRFIENDKLSICFYPLKEEVLLKARSKKSIKNTLKELTGLPSAFLEALFPFGEKSFAALSAKERKEIISKLNNFTTEASTTGLLGAATVTKGGVDTQEVDKKTFESKLVKGLYFIGEVLDVDGECGGYNLTFAFSSAFSVFKAL